VGAVIDVVAQFDRWHRIASQIKMRACWPWPSRIDVRISSEIDGLCAHVWLKAPDMHTEEVTKVHHIQYISRIEAWADLPDSELVAFLRKLLLRSFIHEFDECLLVDGVQYRDPHEAAR
jgi:hypothetical protein